MNDLISQFSHYANAGRLWYGFLLLGVIYLLKKEPFKIFTHFVEKKDQNITQAIMLLECGKLSEEATKLIREYIEREAFRRYYGISAGPKMRASLRQFFEDHQTEIGWHDLKRAFFFIHIRDGELAVKLTIWDRISRWFVTGVSVCIALFALTTVVMTAISVGLTPKNELQFVFLTLVALMLLGTAVFFSTINWPYISAKKIRACTSEVCNASQQ